MNCAMPSAPAGERASASKPLSASSCAASSAGGSCSARAERATSARSSAGHIAGHGELALVVHGVGAGSAGAVPRPSSRRRRASRHVRAHRGAAPRRPAPSATTRPTWCAGSPTKTRSPGRNPPPTGSRSARCCNPAAVRRPTGSPAAAKRVVDETRAVEAALGSALTAPDIRPAELRERRGDHRVRTRRARARPRSGSPRRRRAAQRPAPPARSPCARSAGRSVPARPPVRGRAGRARTRSPRARRRAAAAALPAAARASASVERTVAATPPASTASP